MHTKLINKFLLRNKANIERLDERVTKLEDNTGVISPPELAIQR